MTPAERIADLEARLARCVESRDQLDGAFEYANREAILGRAQLTEVYKELEEALDRAARAEQECRRLRDQVATRARGRA